MKTEVEIKDRENEIEYLRMALNICELPVSYLQTDLIVKIYKRIEKLKGNYSVEDGVKDLNDHNYKWEKYFDNKK